MKKNVTRRNFLSAGGAVALATATTGALAAEPGVSDKPFAIGAGGGIPHGASRSLAQKIPAGKSKDTRSLPSRPTAKRCPERLSPHPGRLPPAPTILIITQ